MLRDWNSMLNSSCYMTISVSSEILEEQKRPLALPPTISTSQVPTSTLSHSPVGLKLVWIMCFPDKGFRLEQCLQKLNAGFMSCHRMNFLSGALASHVGYQWDCWHIPKPLGEEWLSETSALEKRGPGFCYSQWWAVLLFYDLGSREFLPLIYDLRWTNC